jgi:hypothetical protein
VRAREPDFEDTPLWLSHHWPSQQDRCTLVRGRWVCRRCAVLYPLALVAAAVHAWLWTWPERLDPWFLWLLPLPAVVEFLGEQFGLVRHSPGRLVLFSVPLAVACGRLYVRYLDDLTDPLVWSVVIAYGGACLASVLLRTFVRRPPA